MVTEARRRRIVYEVILATLLLGSSLVSVTLIHRLEPGSPQSLAAALLPIPFFALGFYYVYSGARRCDELMQRIQFEALAVAFPLAMILAMAMHLLQRAGAPFHYDLADQFLAMSLLYIAGYWIARRRYR